MSMFDAFYQGQVPSFRARHASLEEIEELLFVRGVTPDLYYGHYIAAADGSMVEAPGLRDCVTTYRARRPGFDVNTAAPAVLALTGLPPQAVEMIVNMRRVAPIRREQFDAMGEILAPAGGKVVLGGGPFYTIRSTGRAFGANHQLLETRRTVTAVVRRNDPKWQLKEPWTLIRYRESDPTERLLFEIWPR
jgi:general secretion pathway protein K